MDYLEGMTAEAYVHQNGPLSYQKALELMLPILDALERIHTANFIHRDVSPQNIMILQDGSARLLDFGAARKYLADGETRGESSMRFGDGEHFSVVLKHGFAPVEQYYVNGRQGPWTDIYAVGATLYFLLTQNVPNDARQRQKQDMLLPPSAVLGYQMSGTEAYRGRTGGMHEAGPDLQGGNTQTITEQQNRVIMRALAIRPEDRYPNISAFRAALKEAALITDPQRTVPIRDDLRKKDIDDFRKKDMNPARGYRGYPEKRTAFLPLAIVLACLLVIGAAIWGISRGGKTDASGVSNDSPGPEEHVVSEETSGSDHDGTGGAVNQTDHAVSADAAEAADAEAAGADGKKQENGQEIQEAHGNDVEGGSEAARETEQGEGAGTIADRDETTENGREETEEDGAAKAADEEPMEEEALVYNTKGHVRIINRKYERNDEFIELAAAFERVSGISVSVENYTSSSKYDKAIAQKLTGSASDPTIFMLKGEEAFQAWGSECLDLTDTDAAAELVSRDYALTSGEDRIYGLGTLVEACGIAVNKDLLKKAGYQMEDIRSFSDLARIARDITRRQSKLGFAAFTSPTIGTSGNYRFDKHAASVPLYFELKDKSFATRVRLEGSYMDEYRDYVDLCLDNATVFRSQATARTMSDARREFMAGKAVFHQDGSWGIDEMGELLRGDRIGVLPLYMGMPGEEKQGLIKLCNTYWCVNKNASQDDIEASLQFLHWAVTSREGLRILNDEMGYAIPYRRAKTPDNAFLTCMEALEDDGRTSVLPYYRSGDDNSWTHNIDVALKNYVRGTGDWDAVRKAFTTLW